MRRSGLFKLLLIATVMSLLIVVLAACGEDETTTTAAPTETTAAPTETTAAPTETTAAPTETTAAPTETTAAATGEPIKIGALLDLTGFLAWTGTDNQKGMELCLELANYQVAGRPIELIIEDSATDPAVATDKAKKLVETDDVHMVLGPVFGAADVAISGYMDDVGKRPRLQLAPTEELVAGFGYEWTFMPHGAGLMYGYATADYTYNDLGYKTCVGMASDFEAGHTFLGSFLDAFKALGGEVVQEIWYPPDTQDFLPFYASVEEADCFVSWWPGVDGLAAFPQYAEAGLTMPIVQPEDGGLTASREALQEIGDPAVGCVAGTLYTYLMETPGNTDFVAAYEAKYDAKPGVFAGAGYATMQFILAVLEATNGDTDPQVLKDAILAIETDTVCGTKYFPSDNNIAVGDICIMQVTEDYEPGVLEVVVVKEEHDSEGNPVLSVVE